MYYKVLYMTKNGHKSERFGSDGGEDMIDYGLESLQILGLGLFGRITSLTLFGP